MDEIVPYKARKVWSSGLLVAQENHR
jgi:hypothetical protein